MLTITSLGFADVKTRVESRSKLDTPVISSEASSSNVAKIALENSSSENSNSSDSKKDNDSVANALTDVARTVVQAVSDPVDWMFEDSDDGDEFEDENEQEVEDEDDSDEDEDSSNSRVTSTQTQTVTTTNTTPVTNTSSTAGTFTLAQVAQHNSSASCYSVIGGSVYDLTSFVTKHPGGQSAIKSLCGVDGTSAFNAQHGGQGTPASVLIQYKIGVLAK